MIRPFPAHPGQLVFVLRQGFAQDTAAKIAASRPNPPAEDWPPTDPIVAAAGRVPSNPGAGGTQGDGLACDKCGAPATGVLTFKGNDHRFCAEHVKAYLAEQDARASAGWDPPPVAMGDAWVIWNLERGRYWAPNRAGYNVSIWLAGVYSEADARQLAHGDMNEARPLAAELAPELADSYSANNRRGDGPTWADGRGAVAELVGRGRS